MSGLHLPPAEPPDEDEARLLEALGTSRYELAEAENVRARLADELAATPPDMPDRAARLRIEAAVAGNRITLWRDVVNELERRLRGHAPRCPHCLALLPFHFDECVVL